MPKKYRHGYNSWLQALCLWHIIPDTQLRSLFLSIYNHWHEKQDIGPLCSSQTQTATGQQLAAQISSAGRFRADVDSGCFYPVEQQHLDDLQDTRIWHPDPSPPLGLTEACDRLLCSPAQSITADKYAKAFTRVQTLAVAPQTWDLAVKAFDDFDTLLFLGELRNRVTICCKPFTEKEGGTTYGGCYKQGYLGDSRVTILLNTRRDYTLLQRNFLYGVLVHEMLHAWFFISCGGQNAGHGTRWRRAAQALEERTGPWIITRAEEKHPAPADRGRGLFNTLWSGLMAVKPRKRAWPAFPDLGTPKIPI